MLAAFRRAELSATAAAEKLGLGRTRFYELYADYLRAAANGEHWQPGASGGDHAADWPAGVEPLLRKLLATKPPAPCRLAASEALRRLDLTLDPATVRRWALAHGLAHPLPKPRPPASTRRWQCLKTSALWQLDATPHRWFPGDKRHYPLLDLLDDCSRVCTGATIYHAEDLLAYLDFLPAAFVEHGLPLELYVDCHSMFFPHCPDALTQLGAALHFYGISLRFARTPQAKGKIERQHQYWQGRFTLSSDGDCLDLFVCLFSGSVPPQTVTNAEVKTHFKRLQRFFEAALDATKRDFEESSPVFDVAQQIHVEREELTRARLFFLTDGIVKNVELEDTTINGISISHHIWDMEKLHRFITSGMQREVIEIDFAGSFDGPVPCVGITDATNEYCTYLAFFPGSLPHAPSATLRG